MKRAWKIADHTARRAVEEFDLAAPTGSVALRRLIEEVTNSAESCVSSAYNRTYHRHNR